MIKLASLLWFWFLTTCCTVTYGVWLTTQETSSLSSHHLVGQLLSDVTAQNIIQSTPVGAPPEEATVKPETSSNTSIQGIPTGATPISSTSQLYLSVLSTKSQSEVKSTVGSSPTMVGVNETSRPTTTPGVPSTMQTSIQSQTAEDTTAFQSTNNGVIHPTTSQQSTKLTASATTSSKLAESKSTTRAVSGEDDVYSTILYKATTLKKPTHTTKKKDKEPPMENPPQSPTNANHSKIVAGLIGGALALMMVGFLVIYMKKRKLRRQQTSTSEWAGPSPFIEGGTDGDQVIMRSLNRISLSSFLPQRLSKRLSLLPETDEELKSMTQINTFGDNHENESSQKVKGNDVQENNMTSVVDP